MNPFCKPPEHLGRRAFLKGTLAIASGLAVANWGSLFNSQTIAAQARKQGKHCILLWMAGGCSCKEPPLQGSSLTPAITGSKRSWRRFGHPASMSIVLEKYKSKKQGARRFRGLEV
jgi:hypothetical protein